MIYLAYLAESKKVKYKKNSIKYFIVRKPVGNIPKGFIHFPYLSPSINLLKNTQRWKENKFNNEEKIELLKQGIDMNSKDAWWTLYVPRFQSELRKRNDVKKGVSIIKENLKQNKNVYLFCYCKDLNRCHRVLVGKYLKELGFEVIFREGKKKKVEENFVQLNIF